MNNIIKGLLEQGHIDKEAAARLEEFEALTKEAGFKDKAKMALESLKQYGRVALMSPMAAGAMTMGGSAYLMNRAEKAEIKREKEFIQASFLNLLEQNPHLKGNIKAEERFQQIAQYSPIVASAPLVAEKIISRTLNDGLNEDDIVKLVTIESGTQAIGSARHSRAQGSLAAGMVRQHGQELIGKGQVRLMKSMVGPAPASDANINVKMQYVMKGLHFSGAVKSKNNPTEFARFLTTHDGHKALAELSAKFPHMAGSTKDVAVWVQNYADNARKTNNKKSWFGFGKQGSVNAELLADQCSLIKQAGWFSNISTKANPGIQALLGATALGTILGGIELGTQYKKTRLTNERINDSWMDVQKRLKKMTDTGSQFAGGIDYNNKATGLEAKRAFQVLSEIAPNLASNPTIATTFVNRSVENENMIDMDVLKSLAETQKNLMMAGEDRSSFVGGPVAKAFGSGFGGIGGASFAKDLVKTLSGVEASNAQNTGKEKAMGSEV